MFTIQSVSRNQLIHSNIHTGESLMCVVVGTLATQESGIGVGPMLKELSPTLIIGSPLCVSTPMDALRAADLDAAWSHLQFYMETLHLAASTWQSLLA